MLRSWQWDVRIVPGDRGPRQQPDRGRVPGVREAWPARYPTTMPRMQVRLAQGHVAPSRLERLRVGIVELEDAAVPRYFDRIVEIDTIGDPNELHAERRASRKRTENVAKEANALGLIQFGRTHLFAPAAHSDGGAARSAQIAHPVDLAPR